MLIARAPVRISFAGGGTDIPAYYEQFGGAVLSTTIDKYVYVVISHTEGQSLQITSSDYRTFYRHGDPLPLGLEGDLKLPRAVLNHFGFSSGIRLFLASEVPPGTGLGSSSAVTVALIKAVSTLCGRRMSSAEIASLACDLEINRLGSPIGKQDQYAAAYGGFNFFDFSKNYVTATPIQLAVDVRKALEQRLLLFYTGASRDSSTILREQKNASERKDVRVLEALHRVRHMAAEARRMLQAGEVSGFGEMLHLGWEEKKRFASRVTNSDIEEYYELARQKGASGGKLTGAGGGGFLLLFCEPKNQAAVTQALEARALRRCDFAFETSGPRILINASQHVFAQAV